MPTPAEIARSIALSNPRAALFLARGNVVLKSYTIQCVFSSALAPGGVVPAYLDDTIGADLFVTDVRSTVNRPTAFAGSIWKAQSDVFNAQNSGIDVKLTVQGGNPGAQYPIEESFAPLELVAPPIAGATSSPLLCNFVLMTMQNVKAEFTLRRTLASDENNTRVAIILRGWAMGCSMYNGLTTDQARAALKAEFGI